MGKYVGYVVLTENTVLSLSNIPTTGTGYELSIKIIQDGSASGFTFGFTSAADFVGGTAPALTSTASAVDMFILDVDDGGTILSIFTAGQDIKSP